jgi:hypothetical protein
MILSLFLLIVVSGSVVAGPMFELSEYEYDWGKTCQHATVGHRFWIESTGDDTLVITKIIPGCGCAKAPIEDSVLAPGEKTPLDIFFSTKSYRGLVEKAPYFETNIDDRKVYVRIKAELIPEPEAMRPVYPSPYKVDVSQFRPTPPRTKTKFYIVNPTNTDYELTLVDNPEHVFAVQMPATVAAGDSARVIIDVKDEYVDQEFEHSLTFSVNDEENSRFSVPVKRMLRIRDRD